jgi:hypothetical protein
MEKNTFSKRTIQRDSIKMKNEEEEDVRKIVKKIQLRSQEDPSQ